MLAAIIVVTAIWISSLAAILAMARASRKTNRRKARANRRVQSGLVEAVEDTVDNQKTLMENQIIAQRILSQLLITLKETPDLSNRIWENPTLRQALKAIKQDEAYQTGLRARHRNNSDEK